MARDDKAECGGPSANLHELPIMSCDLIRTQKQVALPMTLFTVLIANCVIQL